MKNKYIKPITVEYGTVISEIVAGSSVTIGIGKDVDKATTDAGKSRGSWGDLWE